MPAGVDRRRDLGAGDSRRAVRCRDTHLRCRIPMTGALLLAPARTPYPPQLSTRVYIMVVLTSA